MFYISKKEQSLIWKQSFQLFLENQQDYGFFSRIVYFEANSLKSR